MEGGGGGGGGRGRETNVNFLLHLLKSLQKGVSCKAEAY